MSKRKCGCPQHDEYTKDTEFKIIDLRNKTVNKATVQGLIGSRRVNFLCTGCISHFKHQNIETNSTCSTNSKQDQSSAKRFKISKGDEICESIQNGVLSNEELKNIAYTIGQKIQKDISSDIESIENLYKDEENLRNFDAVEWIECRNCVVTSFVRGVLSVNDFKDNPKKALCAAASIDCLYKARSLNLITPLHFAVNLINYHVSGSKLVCNLSASTSPSGSYWTVSNWLSKETESPPPSPPATDITTYFDNNQVLARNWRVRCDAKVSLSAITSVMHLIPSTITYLQKDPSLSPSSWLYRPNLDMELVVDKISQKSVQCNTSFYKIRDWYLTERLTQLAQEQIVCENTDTIQDNIDNINLPGEASVPDIDSLYHHVASGHHTSAPPKTIVSDPIMVNPCSNKSVERVLRDISTLCDLGNDREWTIMGCDGLPYALASRLILKCPELQNLVMTPGLGHYEINMTRAMFKILWDVVIKDLAKILNYKSQKALHCCKNAYNHHKSWQILCIIFFGISDEMMVQYIRVALEHKEEINLTGFYKYLSNAKNQNFLFLKDSILTYLFALLVFRTGVRRNNSEIMMAGRVKFSPLFYGLNMLFYQQIDFLDMKARVLMPKTLLEWWEKNESFSVSGNANKGEGGDFILEAQNRATKQWMPPGLPDEKKWKRSHKNLDSLLQIRENFIPKETTTATKINLRTEICTWRKHVRETKYLTDSHEESSIHTSMSGEKLDVGLVDFVSICKENQQIYLLDIRDGSMPGKGRKLTPVFIKEEDREKFFSIEKKTKAEIIVMTGELIDMLRDIDSNLHDYYKDLWEFGKTKNGKKDELLKLYKEIEEAIEAETTNDDAEDEDDD